MSGEIKKTADNEGDKQMGLDIELLLKNARLPDGLIKDISVSEGRVLHCGESFGHAEYIIDCKNRLCLPGAIDMHVHIRGGEKQSYKETWESGTKSAVSGGVTTVVDQPNTIPPITDAAIYEKRLREAEKQSYCNFGINGGVYPDSDLKGLYEAGALAFGEIFAAPSSYGDALEESQLKDSLDQISHMNATATVHTEIVLKGDDISLTDHDNLRPGDLEANAVEYICKLADPKMKLHFCHLSSPFSIDAVPAGYTLEVMPHHLFLTREMFEDTEKPGYGKVNPPLRDRKIVDAIWNRWDEIDVIASDHAPHTGEEKSAGFSDVPSGIPGTGTMMPLLLARCTEKADITLESVIRKTVTKPAEILGIEPPGFLKGQKADFAVYSNQTETITAERLFSKAGWTPYEGMTGLFPDTVVINGVQVYRDNSFIGRSSEWICGDGYIGRENRLV
ncbi:dihydroorotase [Methanoplanus endosymbiosus]|uniref:Dihydroorotase n=1 Tax=Methanoplanus endosymbiosus TaxID=33865 RepID=A0A9E7PP77_9EURY|nr:dihydroorotase [Methanoplanus endosymbiosus]UUX92346.1 dihydroorotase [Methanoplanus endosymbiosus]